MKFFTPIENFTHCAGFYGVPCYLNTETMELAGRNYIFEILLMLATSFHNEVVERSAQLFASVTGRDYEPGFPLMIWEIVYEEN